MKSIHAKELFTGKEVLKDRYLLFDGCQLKGISEKPEGEMLGSFEVVTPAFIDPHCHIGLVRAGEPSAEAEANDQLDSIMPGADVLDSIQMDDFGFEEAIEYGVLYSCVLPGSGNILGGRSAFIRNYSSNTTRALIRRNGIKAAFGYNPMSVREWKGSRPFTRMGAVALLRKRFDEVRIKIRKKEHLTGEEQTISDLLNGKEILRVHVHKIDDIASLLRLVDEYNLKITVEHSGDVHKQDIYDELSKRNIPVIYGPLDSLAYKVELKHDAWRNIRYLIDSGVRYGLMTDHPVIPQKNLYLTLRWFLRMVLSKQEALELITRKNAEVIGVNDILGTLEKGKWASFICWNGDPFDLASYPVAVFGEGEELLKNLTKG